MNQQIKFLAEDCGMDSHRLPHGYEYCLAGEDSIEQFAHRIIAECILQVMMNHHGSSDEWDRALDNAVSDIKQRFGVE